MTNNKDKESNKTPLQKADQFLKDAQSFESNRFKSNSRLTKFFLGTTILFSVVCLAQMIAINALTQLKGVQHWMTIVNEDSGFTNPVTKLDNDVITHGEAIDKYWLARYVSFRESYDWETIQATYDATNLLSSPNVQTEFKQFYDLPNSPVKVLQDRAVIQVRILSITFLGDIAQVRFEQTMKPTTAGNRDAKPIASRFVATLAYNYVNLPTTEKDRLVNPIGFQVTSYRVDPESK